MASTLYIYFMHFVQKYIKNYSVFIIASLRE